eukprot:jgi/Undpi1/70/HiC_scaffold_1.g00070.m1
MAPSLYGFASFGSLPMRVGSAGYGGRGGAGVAVAAADLASAGANAAGARQGHAFTAARTSPFAAASWLKERVQNGKRRIHMQVMSMVPETHLSGNTFEDAPVPVEDREFLINGWRWHSRSVLRDVARFRQAALFAVEASAGPDGGGKDGHAAVQRVSKCYGYMWTFSFKKLHKTETALFFPWLREFFPKDVAAPLVEFDREREVLIRIGTKIGQLVDEAQTASSAKRSPRTALLRCADLAEELEVKAARLARAQEAVIVPSTAAYIEAKQQWKFNDKVIYSLGLVNAQLFLVSMHDALKPDKEEFKLFRSQVRLGRGEGRKYPRGVGVSAGVGMSGGGGRGERVEGWNRGNGLGIGRGGWEDGGEEDLHSGAEERSGGLEGP